MRNKILSLSLCLGVAGWVGYAQFSKGPVLAQTAPAKPKKNPEDRVKIFSDKAIYKKQEKLAQAIGKVKVIQDNTTIYADELFYYEDTKQSYVDKGVKIVQVNKKKDKGRKTVITSQKMTSYHREKRIYFEKDVRLDREAVKKPPAPGYADGKPEQRERTEAAIKKARTVITADQMEYFTESENANLVGNVVLLQKEKKITGKKAFIKGPEEGDTVTIEEEAKVVQINGEWLLEERILKPKPDDEEQKRLINERMTMTGDKIVLYRATDDMEVFGNVKITQKVGSKERVATSDKATYSDKEQKAVLTGNVRLQRENGDWLTAETVTLFLDKEHYIAERKKDEQVLIETEVNEDGTPTDPKEPINSPAPDFDLDGHQPRTGGPAWLGRQQAPRVAPPKKSTPTPAPTPAPTPTPTPQAAPPTAAPKPTPVESSFTVDIED